jgi:hypothetical protein
VAAGDDSPPAAHPQATAAGMSVELPDGWRQGPAEGGRLEAFPARDKDSGLTVAVSRQSLQRSDQATPVVLGAYEAWRHDAVPVKGEGRVARYVIPAKSGKVEISCTASPGAAQNVLALCERAASTLQLGSQRTLTLAAVATAEERWRLAAGALKGERAQGRRTLARAQRQPAQIAAAEALAGTYEHSARRFAALSNGEPVVKAARETAASYRALARAARSNSSTTWALALAEVRASEARLGRVVAAG